MEYTYLNVADQLQRAIKNFYKLCFWRYLHIES